MTPAHTSTEQPEALRLANSLEGWHCPPPPVLEASVAELRRLHARVQEMEDQLKDAQHTAGFYKPRCDLLQEVQSSMRDPERTVVCDILANGQLLQGSDGKPDAARYCISEASQAQRVPLSDAQIEQAMEWCDVCEGDHVLGAFSAGVRHVEKLYGITQEKQG